MTAKAKSTSLIVATAVLAVACAALLVTRVTGCRGQDLTTRVGTRQLYQPASAEAFKPVEDWPKWRGPRGDGVSREPLGAAWPKDGLKRLWVADVGIGFSSPVAVGGRVYLFSLNNGRDNLTCFDADTGRVVWSHDADAGWGGDYAGARATPAVSGDAIYTFGGRGELACRDLATGTLRWAQDALAATGGKAAQWGTASSPLVEGGLVVVQGGGGGGNTAVAFRADTGAVAWKSQATVPAGYAAPIAVDVDGARQVVVFAAEAVLGLDPASGRTLWQEPWVSNYGVAATTPVYRDGHLLVSTGYGKGCLMLKLSAAGATKAWAKRDLDNKFNGMVLDGDLLFGVSDVRGGGRLTCLSWPDGAVRWKADDSALTVGPGGSVVRAAGDHLLLMSEGGVMTLARASAAGVVMVSQFQALEGVTNVWSTPLVYGGRVYAKAPKELVCFELPR